jgi:S1-C subfamily serine protease
MRQRVLLGLLLGGGLYSGASGAEVDHTLSLSVVQIRAYPGSGKTLFGSGVVVGPNRVVTNCHVTRTALKILVSKGPMPYPAVTQQADTRHDLCLLTTPGIPFPTANLGKTDQLKVGQPLYFYGYPRGIGISFSEGKVEALYPFEGSRIIETSANFTLGASGGGIFAGDGKLVGLATFLSPGHANGYYAIPSDWISSLDAREARRIEPLQGLSFWEDAAALPAFLRPPGH